MKDKSPFNWSEASKKLREKYPSLTDEDLAYEAGKEKETLSRLTNKLGLTSHQLEDLMTQQVSTKGDLKNAYDVSKGAFKNIGHEDHTTYFSETEKPLSETFDDNEEELQKLPPTKAPEEEGYDAGIKHSRTENEPRK